MAYKRVIFTIPDELLKILDQAVAADYKKRSAYIREAIVLKMQLEATIEDVVTSKDSMESVVRSLHLTRLTQRGINTDKLL